MYARSVINTKGSSRSSDAYSLTAGVGVKNPTHDIKLTDLNGVEAGLILSNRSGRQDPRGMSISSMPRTALQMSQGNGGYDDMLPPFVTEVQSTWIGGRAQDTFSNDRTRFAPTAWTPRKSFLLRPQSFRADRIDSKLLRLDMGGDIR